MTYATVKTGITDLLKGLAYQESNTSFDFEDASSQEYGNTFIVTAKSGELEETDHETLVDRIYDRQLWEVQIALPKSEGSEVINQDDIQRRREAIINELDNPTNWKSFVTILKYRNWEIEDKESYIILRLNFTVIDKLIFT